MKQITNIIKAMKAGEEFVIATIAGTQGSTPGRAGFRMLIFRERTEGTIGGGALENQVVKESRELLQKRQEARLLEIKLAELEMTCGGQVSVFLEPCFQRPSVWIFGAGHIARALVPLLASAGFPVTVADNRQGFATTERFPADIHLLTGEYAAAISGIPDGAFAVIVTHGHLHDEEILTALAARQPVLPYIGMIGSKTKVALARRKLAGQGITFQDHIYSPVGLNIGGDTPEEIAIAIAAEILGLYHQRENLPHCRLKSGC